MFILRIFYNRKETLMGEVSADNIIVFQYLLITPLHDICKAYCNNIIMKT